MPAFLALIIPFIQKYWMYIAGGLGLFVIVRKLGFGDKQNVVTQYKVYNSSISSQLALAYAERLYSAMESFGTDTDEMEKVYNVLSLDTEAVKSVYNNFGLREYGTFGAPMFGSGSKIDLKEWCKRELSGKLHDKWMSLFNAAGIV